MNKFISSMLRFAQHLQCVPKRLGNPAAGILLFLGFASTAGAQAAQPWTTVASAGAVDEADVATVMYSGATAQVSPGAPASTTVNIVYPVVAVNGLLTADPGKILRARVVDNGGQARVILTLREMEIATGIIRTRLTFDSDSAGPPSSTSQLLTRTFCSSTDRSWSFNFANNMYYVEAQIIRTNSGGTPALSSIQIGKTSCVQI